MAAQRNDTVTFVSAINSTDSIDLAGGNDKVMLADVANTGSLSNVETVVGGAETRYDHPGHGSASNGSVNLGAGFDTLTLGNFANTATVGNVESLTGGAGADTITLSAAASDAAINLGRGQRRAHAWQLRQRGDGLECRNAGGRQRWPTTSRSAASSSRATTSIWALGADKLTLGDFVNSGNISNVETIVGGALGDAIVVTGQISDASIDLGDGVDKLTLGNFVNTGTIGHGSRRCWAEAPTTRSRSHSGISGIGHHRSRRRKRQAHPEQRWAIPARSRMSKP